MSLLGLLLLLLLNILGSLVVDVFVVRLCRFLNSNFFWVCQSGF